MHAHPSHYKGSVKNPISQFCFWPLESDYTSFSSVQFTCCRSLSDFHMLAGSCQRSNNSLGWSAQLSLESTACALIAGIVSQSFRRSRYLLNRPVQRCSAPDISPKLPANAYCLFLLRIYSTDAPWCTKIMHILLLKISLLLSFRIILDVSRHITNETLVESAYAP